MGRRYRIFNGQLFNINIYPNDFPIHIREAKAQLLALNISLSTVASQIDGLNQAILISIVLKFSDYDLKLKKSILSSY